MESICAFLFGLGLFHLFMRVVGGYYWLESLYIKRNKKPVVDELIEDYLKKHGKNHE